MAEEREPAPGMADSSALEERVARLEQALAALELRLSDRTTADVRAAAKPMVQTAPVTAAKTEQPAANVTSRIAPPPPPPPRFAAAVPQRDETAASLESRIGSQVLNRIAIVALLVGAAYGLKLAVDYGWLGPVARVAIGLVAGAGLVLWSERFRAKGFAAFSYSLKAVGSGVLYLSLWAAFRAFEHPLIPASLALLLMIGVTGWNAFMAWAQDSELLAAYAIAGGFATPILLSTGGNHEIFLFTYLLAIDIATVTLVRLRGWPRLLLGAFPLTVGYFIGWYFSFWHADELAITSIFVVLIAATFGAVPIGPRAADSATALSRMVKRSIAFEDILLPLCNAAFAALAGYSVLQDSGHHDLLPWLMVALAAVYLALMRAPQTHTASAIHLSLAVAFLTIAIPLKASGHWITVSWLAEGLALMWVASRLGAPGEDAAAEHAGRVLQPLATASLLLGFCGVCEHAFAHITKIIRPAFDSDIQTCLIGIAILATVAWLALRSRNLAHASWVWDRIAVMAFVLIGAIAAFLCVSEIASSQITENQNQVHPAFRSADLATALIGLAVLAGVIAVSLQLAHNQSSDDFWTTSAVLSTIAFNVIGVLTGVREVSAAFAPAAGATDIDSALKQALAISAWLMLYGALLLAVGFWRRSSFLRWQALALLAITIVKAFLYDMRDLSQGYRVASFLALGGLLMAVSFAYQKDWLNLREATAPVSHTGDSSPESKQQVSDAGTGAAQ